MPPGWRSESPAGRTHGWVTSPSPALGLVDQIGRACIFQELRMGFFPAIENHTHLPRLRKHLPILNRGLVVHVVGANQSVTFDDMQRVTVEIPRSIEPGLAIEIRHVDDQ